MARHRIYNRNKSISAPSYQPKISSRELAERFAKIRLTPASETQSHVKKKADKRMKSKILSKENVKVNNNHNNNPVTEGAIPLIVYRWVKEAADVMKRPGWPSDDGVDEGDLRMVEYKIGVACRVFSHALPLGWKYEREHASSFIAGYDYDKVFSDDALKYIKKIQL